MKTLFALAALVFGLQANAMTAAEVRSEVINTVAQSVVANPGWVVGDSADYNLAGGIINGTMHMFVREQVSQGTWIEQDMDLGFLGKQKVEVLYAPDGKILELIANGQKQTPPAPGDQKIIETRKESVTVPKGTFECLYAKIQDVKNNQTSEVWINRDVPVAGMVKTMSPSQLGTITIELTGFQKN